MLLLGANLFALNFLIVPHTWFMQNALEGHTLHCL